MNNEEAGDLVHQVAVEGRKIFRNAETEQQLATQAMSKVSPEQREVIRDMYAEMANYLRKECKLTIPEIRKVLQEMFTVL